MKKRYLYEPTKIIKTAVVLMLCHLFKAGEIEDDPVMDTSGRPTTQNCTQST